MSNLHFKFNFWHSGTLGLNSERQSARMSEIEKCRLDLDGIAFSPSLSGMDVHCDHTVGSGTVNKLI